jgi:membrane protein DedA with SNARE-associated domain/rhodanese-related sulfurtransferase
MNPIVQYLVNHGYAVLFASVFARQMCLPVPALLFLLAAGALAGSGRLILAVVLALAVIACVLADLVWYEAGRRWGEQILHFICGLSLDPEAAVGRSKKNFARYGPRVLVVAKFVVGLDAAAPPLAGLSGTSLLRFIGFDAVGAALWSGAYVGLGYVFSKDLDRAVVYAARMGRDLAIVVLAGLTIYVGRKLVRWHRFMREFRLTRITPEDLKERLDAGEKVLIVDLQGRLGHPRDRQGIPGAVRIDPHKLEQYDQRDKKLQIPRDCEIVLYCATPHEFTSARVALALHRRGFEHVRPLAGGLRAWRERGFPLTLGVPMMPLRSRAQAS